MVSETTYLNGSGERRRSSNGVGEWTRAFLVINIIVALLVIIAVWEAFFVVPPGMIGVVVTLGHVKSHENGFHMRLPYVSRLDMISAKTQKLEEENTTPTKEGLSVKLDTVVLFHVDESKIEELYTLVGTKYIDVLLQPETASAIRCYTSESEAKDLYTSGRKEIQDELRANLSEKLEPRGIIIEDVLLKDLLLPSMLSKSIELKLQTEQEAKQMVFVLEKEQFEAERKSIEAGGIAEFQRIVSEGISPQLLQWKGIEATEKFAGAPNTKIVLMGNDSKGLPVLLSAEEN